jgi:DMSO/TMAO reductase YedYZ molybdopterin-dependent catalytic subunit
MTKHTGVWRSLVIALLGLALQGLGGEAIAQVSQQVRVEGAVKTPLLLSVEDLKAFPAEQIATLTVHRKVDDKDVPSTLRGVRLTSVLERAGLLASDERHDGKHTIVVASGTDGYRVVFSWPELFHTEHGGEALVVFERDGQALADREGRIALAPGGDLRSGPRSVHWLARLDVRVLKD